MQLRKATRKQAKIRLGLSAVSGGGKTYSAIQIAKGLCGDLSKVSIIDTENGSADLYAHLGEFNVLPLTAPFTPERYIEAIKTCEAAGMEVIIIDSISHEWDGKGGSLEIVESLGGKYQDWAKVTPRHQAFIEAILHSPAHIITTVRRKQDYEMIKENGKIRIEKGGLKEITREGFEYELTVNLELDTTHHVSVSKDRTGLFMGKPTFIPTEATGKLIADWCNQGDENLDVSPGSEWYKKIEVCGTVAELVGLYQANKFLIDTNPVLQQLIGNRRNKINFEAAAKQKQSPITNESTQQTQSPITTNF
jgi:hypothetical protein